MNSFNFEINFNASYMLARSMTSSLAIQSQGSVEGACHIDERAPMYDTGRCGDET